jgi:hypothetical protein
MADITLKSQKVIASATAVIVDAIHIDPEQGTIRIFYSTSDSGGNRMPGGQVDITGQDYSDLFGKGSSFKDGVDSALISHLKSKGFDA